MRKIVSDNMPPASTHYPFFVSPSGPSEADSYGLPARKWLPAKVSRHATRKQDSKSKSFGLHQPSYKKALYTFSFHKLWWRPIRTLNMFVYGRRTRRLSRRKCTTLPSTGRSWSSKVIFSNLTSTLHEVRMKARQG